MRKILIILSLFLFIGCEKDEIKQTEFIENNLPNAGQFHSLDVSQDTLLTKNEWRSMFGDVEFKSAKLMHSKPYVIEEKSSNTTLIGRLFFIYGQNGYIYNVGEPVSVIFMISNVGQTEATNVITSHINYKQDYVDITVKPFIDVEYLDSPLLTDYYGHVWAFDVPPFTTAWRQITFLAPTPEGEGMSWFSEFDILRLDQGTLVGSDLDGTASVAVLK